MASSVCQLHASVCPVFHRPCSPRFRDTTETMLTQFGGESEQLRLDHRRRRVELVGERNVHVAETTALRHQAPRAGDDPVQPEIRAAFQVENDALPCQLAYYHLVGRRQTIIERKFR